MSALHLRVVGDGATAAPPPGSLRVAIATQDMKSLNAHFGSARRFALYDVSPVEWSFVEAVSFDDVSDESGSHKTEGEDKIAAKVAGLAGCHLLFCLAIGGPSAAKVVASGIHPVKMPAAQSIEAVLERTREMLSGSPPPWLRKVLAGAGAVKKPAFDDED
jgi:nitrogen fixation protein NifX